MAERRVPLKEPIGLSGKVAVAVTISRQGIKRPDGTG